MTTYRTTPEYVMYTVLNSKLLDRLAKQYKKQVDKLFNEEEAIQARQMKTRIGKEFLVAEDDELSKEFNINEYLEKNLNILKQYGVENFLKLHGWTMERLCEYFTNVNGHRKPIKQITI